VSDPRAICADCGHVRSWHDRDTGRAMASGETASDRRCYREIGGAGCGCSGFRDSGEVAVLAVSSRAGGNVLTLPLLIVLLVVMGLAMLYAYRSQTPSVQRVVYSEAVQQINSGQVRKVTIVANKATLELQNNASSRRRCLSGRRDSKSSWPTTTRRTRPGGSRSTTSRRAPRSR
jgi:hypothetical protein